MTATAPPIATVTTTTSPDTTTSPPAATGAAGSDSSTTASGLECGPAPTASGKFSRLCKTKSPSARDAGAAAADQFCPNYDEGENFDRRHWCYAVDYRYEWGTIRSPGGWTLDGYITWRATSDITLNAQSRIFNVHLTVKTLAMNPANANTVASYQAVPKCGGTCRNSLTPVEWAIPRTFPQQTATHTGDILYEWNGALDAEEMINPYLEWRATAAGYPGEDDWASAENQFPRRIRCDNKVFANPGCVIKEKIPTVDMRNSGSASAMIFWAQLNMDKAWGLEGYGPPLKRGPAVRGEVKNKWGEDNRGVICPDSYNPPPLEWAQTSCDEFPFATSRESHGAVAGASGNDCQQVKARWDSAVADYRGLQYITLADYRPKAPCIRGSIPLSQNQSTGGILGNFVKDERVLPDDAYWVNADQSSDMFCEMPGPRTSLNDLRVTTLASGSSSLCDFRNAYQGAGGLAGLGLPLADPAPTADGIGQYVLYQRPGESTPTSGIYSYPFVGTHIVSGAIFQKWSEKGREGGSLGYPYTDEFTLPDQVGRGQHFWMPEARSASIYWKPDTGAHSIQGAVWSKWAALGYEGGPLGYPTTDEQVTPDGYGRYNHFSKNASVYWTPSTAEHAVTGFIRNKWAEAGWEQGVGYPTTDELSTPDGWGRFNHFWRLNCDCIDDSIYWHPEAGAHWIHGAIRNLWAQFGWEWDSGYPVTDELAMSDGVGRQVIFGARDWCGTPSMCIISIYYWHPDTGAHWIHIDDLPSSWLRYPIAEPRYDGGTRDDTDVLTLQLFQDGCVGLDGNMDKVTLWFSSNQCSLYAPLTPETWNTRWGLAARSTAEKPGAHTKPSVTGQQIMDAFARDGKLTAENLPPQVLGGSADQTGVQARP